MENKEILQTLKRLEQKFDSVFTNPNEKEFYSVKEAEALLGISRSTFDRFRKDGLIKTTRYGRQLRVNKSEIIRIQAEGIKI